MDLVPDYIEPLRGFRVWHVRCGTELQSLCGTDWPPFAALEARPCMASPAFHSLAERIRCDGPPCTNSRHGHQARCGIYAFSTRDRLLRTLREESVLHNRSPLVVGEVWLWGRIARHEHGYRAQYAYPAKFIGGYGCDPLFVAATYGIPYEEDASCTSVSNSVASWRSRCGPPFPSAAVRQPHVRTATTPIVPAVWLKHPLQPRTRTAGPPPRSRSVLATCKRLAAWSCRADVLRLVAMMRGSRTS